MKQIILYDSATGNTEYLAKALSHAPRTHVPANHGAVLGEFTLKAADDLRKIRLIRTKAGGAEEKDLLACQ